MGERQMEGEATVMIEMQLHPERFCLICRKRVGTCKHTRKEVPIVRGVW